MLFIIVLLFAAVLTGGCGGSESTVPDPDQTSAETLISDEQADTDEANQSDEGSADDAQTSEHTTAETTEAEAADEMTPEQTDDETTEVRKTQVSETTAETETTSVSKTETTTAAETEPEQTTTTTVNTPAEPVAVLLIEAKSAAAAGMAGVPEDGIILPPTTYVLDEDETVADLLIRAGREQRIAVAYQGSGGSTFITGIAGITATDAKSGWMFSVNGEYVQVGAGSVRLSSGDEVAWRYTIDSGNDLP